MRLVDLSTILQNYCHEGKSLDRIIIEYKDKHFVLDKVEIKTKQNEEDVILELKEETI